MGVSECGCAYWWPWMPYNVIPKLQSFPFSSSFCVLCGCCFLCFSFVVVVLSFGELYLNYHSWNLCLILVLMVTTAPNMILETQITFMTLSWHLDMDWCNIQVLLFSLCFRVALPPTTTFLWFVLIQTAVVQPCWCMGVSWSSCHSEKRRSSMTLIPEGQAGQWFHQFINRRRRSKELVFCPRGQKS